MADSHANLPIPSKALALATKQEFGPCMSALNDRQKAFVIAHYQSDGKSATASARAAGYETGQSMNSLKLQAYRLIHSPKVQLAMQEYGRGTFQVWNPAMIKNMAMLALKGKSEQVRQAATADMLNRGGLSAVVNVHHEHQHVISYDEKLLELQRLARLAGDDPQRAIEGLPTVSDAVYEEVE
jgi:phage terminase small subunit